MKTLSNIEKALYENQDFKEFLSEMILSVRKKYKIGKEFPFVEYSSSFNKINNFAKARLSKKELTIFVTDTEDDENEFVTFFYDGPDYKIATEFMMGGDKEKVIAFIFKKTIDCEKAKEAFHGKENSAHKKLPPAVYKLVKRPMIGYIAQPIPIEDVISPFLNENMEKKVFNDMDMFFKNKEFYKTNNLPFRRGVLLYGPPGNGKTMFIKYMLKQIVEMGYAGILMNCGEEDLYSSMGEFLKTSFGDTAIVLVIEDIDGIERYNRSEFLNFIDGVKPLHNVFIIATTNYPEKVDTALINRPSRFDKIYNFKTPNRTVRKKLLKYYFKTLQNGKLDEFADLTKDFSGAYFKELFIVKNIQNVSLKDAIDSIKEQIKFLKESVSSDGDTDYVG